MGRIRIDKWKEKNILGEDNERSKAVIQIGARLT